MKTQQMMLLIAQVFVLSYVVTNYIGMASVTIEQCSKDSGPCGSGLVLGIGFLTLVSIFVTGSVMSVCDRNLKNPSVQDTSSLKSWKQIRFLGIITMFCSVIPIPILLLLTGMARSFW